MIYFLSTFCIILLMAGGISKLFDLLLHEHTKDEVRINLENIWLKYADCSPIIVFQIPFHLLNSILDILFGERYFSKQALFRAAFLSLAILISSIIVTGWITKTTVGMGQLPWKYFEINMETAKKLSQINISNEIEKQYKGKIEKPSDKEAKHRIEESMQYIKHYCEYFMNFNTLTWKIIYSILFIVSLCIVNAFIDSISLAITRQMLKEIIQTQSIVLVSTILFTNLCIAFLFSTLTLFLTLIISTPLIIPYLHLIPITFIKYPSWSSLGLYAASIVTWKLAGPWLKVVAITTILPSIFLSFILVISVVLYPFRRKMYYLMDFLLTKALDYPKGVFAFLTILLTSIGAIIGCIIKLIG